MARAVHIIAAVSDNGIIGRDGTMPWHLGADLKRFRALTWGHTIIMGRRTYESIGRPLPGRRSIVLSRQPDYAPPGLHVAADLDAALALTDTEETAFLIGGAAVYRAGLAVADTMHLTRIHAAFDGDVRFPAFDPAHWTCVERERHAASEDEPLAYTFERYQRAAGGGTGTTG